MALTFNIHQSIALSALPCSYIMFSAQIMHHTIADVCNPFGFNCVYCVMLQLIMLRVTLVGSILVYVVYVFPNKQSIINDTLHIITLDSVEIIICIETIYH